MLVGPMSWPYVCQVGRSEYLSHSTWPSTLTLSQISFPTPSVESQFYSTSPCLKTSLSSSLLLNHINGINIKQAAHHHGVVLLVMTSSHKIMRNDGTL
jgi:hypothetical protein